MFAAILLLSVLQAADQGLLPLDGALWKGTLEISLQGEAVNQYLGNRLNEEGELALFDQEKGRLQCQVSLRLHFYLNALGEFTLYAEEQAQLSEELKLESKYKKVEEFMEPGGIKVPAEVQYVESKETTCAYGREASYDRDSFTLGSLQFQPKGRMDRKGEIAITGNLLLHYEGTGKFQRRLERQPSGDFAVLNETANIRKSLEIPLNFSLRVEHRRKALAGQLQVQHKMSNPFVREEGADTRGRDIYNDRIVASGSYQLEPVNQ
jgi:hypothetical protein